MKKHLITTIFGSLLVLSAFAVKAQSVDSTGRSEAALIKYLGTLDDMAIFSVSFSNPDGTTFSLAVKDQDGSELYRHAFHGRDFHKQFRLPRADKSKLSFIIRDEKEMAIEKTFEIDATSRFTVITGWKRI